MDLKEYINELFYQNRPILTSGLTKLSGLNRSDFKQFIERWDSVNVERRRQIISKMEELTETNPELDFERIFESALKDHDPIVRIKALDGLVESEEYHMIDSIMQVLKEDSETSVQAAATITLGNFALLAELGKIPADYGVKVERALREVIDSPTVDNEVKRRAVEAIAPFNSPHVKNIISIAYRSDDKKTRCSALYAMGRNCDRCWLSILMSELNNSDAELRFEAARALGEIGEEEAAPALIKLLSDSDIEVKTAVVTSLGEIGGREAKKALLGCLEKADLSIKEVVEEALALLDFYDEPLSLST